MCMDCPYQELMRAVPCNHQLCKFCFLNVGTERFEKCWVCNEAIDIDATLDACNKVQSSDESEPFISLSHTFTFTFGE